MSYVELEVRGVVEWIGAGVEVSRDGLKTKVITMGSWLRNLNEITYIRRPSAPTLRSRCSAKESILNVDYAFNVQRSTVIAALGQCLRVSSAPLSWLCTTLRVNLHPCAFAVTEHEPIVVTPSIIVRHPKLRQALCSYRSWATF